MELPNVTLLEPAYGVALDWLLCSALGDIAAAAAPGGAKADAVGQVEDGSYYFRLTTRPLDQAPFEAARARIGDATLRRQVLSGAYRLVESPRGDGDGPVVQIAASGATVPEALLAAAELESEGVRAHVVDVTSVDRLYAAWQRTLRQGIRTATTPSIAGALRQAFDMNAPVVTVHDASSHTMSWLGSALGCPVRLAGRGLVRPVGHRRRPLPGARPRRRVGRQRRPGGAGAALTRAVASFPSL